MNLRPRDHNTAKRQHDRWSSQPGHLTSCIKWGSMVQMLADSSSQRAALLKAWVQEEPACQTAPRLGNDACEHISSVSGEQVLLFNFMLLCPVRVRAAFVHDHIYTSIPLLCLAQGVTEDCELTSFRLAVSTCTGSALVLTPA